MSVRRLSFLAFFTLCVRLFAVVDSSLLFCALPVLDYIEEAAPLVNKYISVPKDYGDLNCAAFCAGIINGVLNSAGFPANVDVKVLAKTGESDSLIHSQPLTIYYIKFAPEVVEREKRLNP